MASAEYTIDDVRQHNTLGDLWIIVDGNVYDITSFAGSHPGGEEILAEFAGTDCTETFRSIHSTTARNMLAQYRIGVLVDQRAAPLPSGQRSVYWAVPVLVVVVAAVVGLFLSFWGGNSACGV